MSELLRRMKNEEYTGENRCTPCTIINVVISGLLSSISYVLNPYLAPVVLVSALTIVYLRGYLVPGTPTLTKRYLPRQLLAWFGKTPLQTETNEEFVIDFLTTVGVVIEKDGDLHLVPEYAAAWREELDPGFQAVSMEAELGNSVGIPQGEMNLQGENSPRLLTSGEIYAQWPSRAAVRADILAARVLSNESEWKLLTIKQRLAVLRGVRTFLDQCPVCGTGPEFSEETRESCCATQEVVTITCTACENRLLELPV